MAKKAKVKQNYIIDNEKRLVFVKTDKPLTADEMAQVQFFLSNGFQLQQYVKPPIVRKVDKDGIASLNDKKIIEALESDEKALDEYKAKKKAGGFLEARNWYYFDHLGNERKNPPKPKKEKK